MTDQKKAKIAMGTLSEDLANTLHCLSCGIPYESKTWRLFRYLGNPDKRYTLNDLTALLSDLRNNKVRLGVMRYSKGDLEHAKNNPDTADYLKDVSAINLRDFIYGCCYDKLFLDTWKEEIIEVIMAPVRSTDPDAVLALIRILDRINLAVNTGVDINKKVH